MPRVRSRYERRAERDRITNMLLGRVGKTVCVDNRPSWTRDQTDPEA
jgi:hypothetical protein